MLSFGPGLLPVGKSWVYRLNKVAAKTYARRRPLFSFLQRLDWSFRKTKNWFCQRIFLEHVPQQNSVLNNWLCHLWVTITLNEIFVEIFATLEWLTYIFELLFQFHMKTNICRKFSFLLYFRCTVSKDDKFLVEHSLCMKNKKRNYDFHLLYKQ